MIEIMESDFSLDHIIRDAKHEDVGAMVAFLGTVRNDKIIGIEIEAYHEAALEEIDKIKGEAISKFLLKSVHIIHRIGSLSVCDNIVLILCSAAHRNEAFEGCRYILEELKSRVPIWKKEIREGSERWIRYE